MNLARSALLFALATLFLFLSCNLFAQQQETAKKTYQKNANSVDRGFINEAAQANLAEIETAKLVLQKSPDPAVKDFANRMITDHTQASHALTTLAEMSGIELPSQPGVDERQGMEKLQKLSGASLDQTYLRDELGGHKKVISEFEKEIEQGQDPDVRHFAEHTLPTLQDHIRIAENVAGELGISSASGLADPAKAITDK